MYTITRKRNRHFVYLNTAGFTLVETIVALALCLMITLGATQVFLQGIKHVRIARADAILAENAGYIAQALRYEVHGAESISVDPAGNSVTLLGRDGISHNIAQVGTTLEFDGVAINHEGVQVTNLEFEQVGGSLRILFTLDSGPRTLRTFVGQTSFTIRT